MDKTLIVYYSLTGTTQKLAEELALLLGADLDRIEDPAPRVGLLGYARSGLEALTKGIPAIRVHRDPRDYRFVILGTPVWTGTMASPLRTYLMMHHDHLRRIACFCTQDGRGGESTLREIQSLCGGGSAPTYVTTQAEFNSGRYQPTLHKFVTSLRLFAAGDVPIAA